MSRQIAPLRAPVAALAALAAFMLAACRSAPTQVFVLEPVASAAAPSAYRGPPIRVDAVHVPPALDRNELVLDAAQGELEIRDLDSWAAPLGAEARQALSADLVSRLAPGLVVFPHLAKPPDARGLTVDVLTFHADRAGASLEASWVLRAADGRSTGGTAVLTLAQPSGTAGTMASAWSLLLARLADRIVAGLD